MLHLAQHAAIILRLAAPCRESGPTMDRLVSGDPLEIPTQIELAFIQVRRVPLGDRQKRLWEKYKEKCRRPGAENP